MPTLLILDDKKAPGIRKARLKDNIISPDDQLGKMLDEVHRDIRKKWGL